MSSESNLIEREEGRGRRRREREEEKGEGGGEVRRKGGNGRITPAVLILFEKSNISSPCV